MDILRKLNEEAEHKGLSFILVGGHALNLHGVSRQTADVDILVTEDRREDWRDLVLRLGYRLFHEHRAFMQFSPPRLEQWPIDIMLVPQTTFQGLLEESQTCRLGGVSVTVPSVEHLLALKIHALKQVQTRRQLHDVADIIELVDIVGIDVTGEPFAALCHRYGTEEIYGQIVKAWNGGHSDSAPD